ncbi:hypothetical protein AC579_8012 [Pseudocercospora musae]|uniref:Uncharacterized protein n=1 Tax=Pseudocercospora musae TaxID=113226 RepID=A0A139HEC6_9PEZI|nr:hypothetical protein AC579_8012 [Pseudocercospora musae]
MSKGQHRKRGAVPQAMHMQVLTHAMLAVSGFGKSNRVNKRLESSDHERRRMQPLEEEVTLKWV